MRQATVLRIDVDTQNPILFVPSVSQRYEYLAGTLVPALLAGDRVVVDQLDDGTFVVIGRLIVNKVTRTASITWRVS